MKYNKDDSELVKQCMTLETDGTRQMVIWERLDGWQGRYI